ncbi:Clp protease N-terminal domain-containing protein [Dactylosporangium sp. CA-092794]|uniref:Clp protease N-terminal domain-containing protein n=1 Tax=Dactylosporangium sp. CA-092794 TaxID=3239929 RepID=UPI003D8A6234
MTKPYSDRARRVLARAELLAAQSEREVPGAWYVLLGLLDEPASLAHNVLTELDIDIRALRQAVAQAVSGIRDDGSAVEGLEEVLRGAQSAASTLSNNVGTEHLLLGLLSLGAEASVVRFLADFGVDMVRVRSEIGRFLGQYGIEPSRDLANRQAPASAMEELASLREARRQAVKDGRIDDAAHLRDLEKDLLRRISSSSDSV